MRRERAHPGWGPTLLLAGGLAAARIAYLVWLSPYELVADEAYYWDWSRHLSASYYSKGPGVAFTIAAATAVFGTSEAAVRLPAVLFGALAALAVAALAGELARATGDAAEGTEAVARRVARARFLGVALFSLAPLFQATSLLMTIDGPCVALWALSALCAWRLRGRLARGAGGTPLWALLGGLVGVGFLFKYTILLLPVGLAAFFLLDRPACGAVLARGALVATAVFALVASPVLLWNAAHGWPTVAHLLGHTSLPGGDAPARPPWRYSPLWSLELAGSQLAAVGPVVGLVLLSVLRTARDRRWAPPGWPARSFAVWCAAPSLLFHAALSLAGKVQGNWPATAWLTLLALAAERVASSGLAGAPAVERRLLRAAVAFGLATGLGMLALPAIASLPVAARLVPLGRLSGARARAADVARGLEAAGLLPSPPLLVTPHYAQAALLAFYLPGRPSVSCASRYLGGRPSAYDFFDVSVGREETRRRPVVLVGAPEAAWRAAFSLSCGPARPLTDAAVLAPCLGDPLSPAGR